MLENMLIFEEILEFDLKPEKARQKKKIDTLLEKSLNSDFFV